MMTTRLSWHPHERPPKEVLVTQVYAFLRSEDGRYLLLATGDGCTLPGGTPERYDVDELATLRRECQEEAQATFVRPVYLGYARVDEGARVIAQVRYRADLDELRPAAPDPATGATYERVLAGVDEIARMLAWGEHGEAQVATLRSLG